MGDLVELTTRHKQPHFFYAVSSSAISFETQARNIMSVGLARNKGHSCEYWVSIQDAPNGNFSLVKIEDTSGQQTKITQERISPRIGTGSACTKYWLSWYYNKIQLRLQGDKKPVIVHTCRDVRAIKYVAFSHITNGFGLDGTWKFIAPPPFPTSKKIKAVPGGRPMWVQVIDQIPDDAVIGGFEKETLYIIRAHLYRSVTPGKFVPSLGVGYVPWGGDAHETSIFDVLCGFNYVWVPTNGDSIPVEAVPGGQSEDRYERLYIGRAYHEGYLIPGKVQPSHKCCYIPFEGKEIAKRSFEVLIEPDYNAKCANRTFDVDYSGCDPAEFNVMTDPRPHLVNQHRVEPPSDNDIPGSDDEDFDF